MAEFRAKGDKLKRMWRHREKESKVAHFHSKGPHGLVVTGRNGEPGKGFGNMVYDHICSKGT